MKCIFVIYCKDTKTFLPYYPIGETEHLDDIAVFDRCDKAYDYLEAYIKGMDKMNKRKNEKRFYRVETMNVR